MEKLDLRKQQISLWRFEKQLLAVTEKFLSGKHVVIDKKVLGVGAVTAAAAISAQKLNAPNLTAHTGELGTIIGSDLSTVEKLNAIAQLTQAAHADFYTAAMNAHAVIWELRGTPKGDPPAVVLKLLATNML